MQASALLSYDDKWKVPITKNILDTPEQVKKIKTIAFRFCFKYSCHSFEDLLLQQHSWDLEP